MTGYKVANLKIVLEELGEERTTEILSKFSCPLNGDVETFLHKKAIEFAKQGFSQTHIVFAAYKEKPQIAGYFTLANKYITINSEKISSRLRRRINKFATFDRVIRSYCLSTPLIAQLGKNYTDGLDKLITGDELLKIACDKVARIQFELGGKLVYLECEDKPKLLDFYTSNGFCEFDRRTLDKDETGIDGEYLVQMLKYIH